MTQIERTGKRPLLLEGETEIYAGSSQQVRGQRQNRWHELAIYETPAKKIVVAIGYRTQWEGEASHDDCIILASREEAATALEKYRLPNLCGIGYPPTPTYAARQARAVAELEAGLRELAQAAIAAMGVSERIQ
jgi:hypothetical protein